MSTLEDLEALEREGKEEDKKDEGDKDKKTGAGDAEMKDAAEEKKEDEEEDEDVLDEEILGLSTRDIQARRRLIENDTRIMKSEFQRLTHEKHTMGEKIRDNLDKIENNRCVILSKLPQSQSGAAGLVMILMFLGGKTATLSCRQRGRNP
jgi:26S proteasome regulatory subunit T5